MAQNFFPYNYSQYSVWDIITELGKKGLPGEFVIYADGICYRVLPYNIYIHLPAYGFKVAHTAEEFDYPRTVTPKISKEDQAKKIEVESYAQQHGLEYQDALSKWIDEERKLYNSLKRKYQMKGEYTNEVKDRQKIEAFIRKFRRSQTWWGKLLGL